MLSHTSGCYPDRKASHRQWTQASNRRWTQRFASGLAVISLLGLVTHQHFGLPPTMVHARELVVQDGAAQGAAVQSAAVQTLAVATQNTFPGKYKALTPDGLAIITYTATDGRSHLSALNGSEQIIFEGEFQTFTADGQQLLTYSNGLTRLYTLTGEKQATFEGSPIGFTPDQRGLLAADDFSGTVRMIGGIFPTRLYDLNGVEQAVFPGKFEVFMPDKKGLIATCICESGLVSRIFSFDGSEQATLQGSFVAFSPDEQSIVTTDYEKTRLYDLNGSLKAVLRGQLDNVFPSNFGVGLPNIARSDSFTPDQQGLITSTDDTARLYSFDGDLQHTYRGRFWSFTPDGAGLITYAFNRQSWLYKLDGTLQATFAGKLLGFTPNEQSLIVQHRNQSQLYDLNGNFQQDFPGGFLSFMPDGQGLITNSSGADGYHSSLYKLNGGEPVIDEPVIDEPVILEGLFLGFAADQQRIVTSSGGIYGPYTLYHLDGRLHTTSEIWPKLTPSRQGFMVVANGQSQLHELAGSAQTTFPGTFQSFTSDGQGLITYVEASGQSQLYPFENTP